MNEHELQSELIDLICAVGDPAAPETQLLGECGSCGRSLPWPMPSGGEWAAPLSCPLCGRWYFSQCRNQQELFIDEGFSTGKVMESFSRSAPGQVESIIGQLGQRIPQGVERRKEPRIPVDIPAVIVALSESAVPRQAARDAKVVNISWNGAELHCEQDINTPYLLIDFTCAGCLGEQLISKVRWQKVEGGKYRVGCEFVNKPGAPMPLEDDTP